MNAEQYLKQVMATRLLCKYQHDSMKVVSDFLNTQFQLCSANKIRFFVPLEKRTKADEDMMNFISVNKQLKMKG